jgi:hypothetical protein
MGLWIVDLEKKLKVASKKAVFTWDLIMILICLLLISKRSFTNEGKFNTF